MEKGAHSLSLTFSPKVAKKAAFMVILLQVGCASSPPEKSAAEISGTSRPFAVLPEAPPALPPPPPIRDLQATAPKSVKVISEGSEEAQPTLIEASRRAKARKQNEGESRPVIEITDDNLKEFSSGGQVFVLEAGEPAGETVVPEPTEPSKSPQPDAEPNRRVETNPEGTPTVNTPEAERELFWRQSLAELRVALRHTLDDLKRLELESSRLRQQFYSEGDPFVRDAEVKPRWDRSLDQLSALREKAKEDYDALSSLLTEAKRAGVSRVWLEGDEEALKLIDEAARLIEERGQAKQ